MLPICYICLRSDVQFRILGTLPEDQAELISFCDQLCDYNFQESIYQFCPECMNKLKKCLEFKNNFKLAGDIIKTWKETPESKRVSLTELYTQIPSQSQAHFSHKSAIETKSNPLFVTVTSPSVNNLNIINIKQEIPVEIEMDTETSKDMSETEFKYNVEIKKEICTDSDENDLGGDDNDLSGYGHGLSGDGNESSGDENGSSVDETYTPKRITRQSKNAKNEKKVTKRIKVESELEKIERRRARQRENWRRKAEKKRQNKLPESERTKEYLREKLKKLNVNNDKERVLIDSIISCLDDMPPCFIRECGRIIGSGPISASDIDKLSETYTHYLEIASAFEIEILTDNAQAEAEFNRRREYPEYLNAKHRCEVCFTAFKSQKRLDFHYRILHNMSHPYGCDLCKWRFKTKHQMTWHYTKIHKTVYRCRRCPGIINDREAMEKHFRKHEGTRIKYTCEICSIELKYRCQYYAHMKTHKQNVPTLNCEFCPFTSHSLSGLTLHKNRLHTIHIGELML